MSCLRLFKGGAVKKKTEQPRDADAFAQPSINDSTSILPLPTRQQPYVLNPNNPPPAVPLVVKQVPRQTCSIPASKKSQPPSPPKVMDQGGRQRGEPFDSTSPIIIVNIGSPATSSNVHKDVLQRSSAFLQAKIKDVWLKSSTTVEIPNHSPDAFRLYLDWLYTWKTDIIKCAYNQSDQSLEGLEVAKMRIRSGWITITKAYVLGEELIDIEFQDDLLRLLQGNQRCLPAGVAWSMITELVNVIYDGTPEGSPARVFIVALYSEDPDKWQLRNQRDTLPAEFLFDMLMFKTPEAIPSERTSDDELELRKITTNDFLP